MIQFCCHHHAVSIVLDFLKSVTIIFFSRYSIGEGGGELSDFINKCIHLSFQFITLYTKDLPEQVNIDKQFNLPFIPCHLSQYTFTYTKYELLFR